MLEDFPVKVFNRALKGCHRMVFLGPSSSQPEQNSLNKDGAFKREQLKMFFFSPCCITVSHGMTMHWAKP